MSPAPHHDDLVRELEAVQNDGQAAHLVRQLHHQARTAAALRRSLSALTGDVSPEQAYRAQTTENAWRAIEREYGLFSAAEVAQVVGSTAKSAKSYATDARKAGRLLAVKRMNKLLYPGFQLTHTGPLLVIRHLHQTAQRLEVGEESVLLWLTAPTTWWGEDSRPVDHLQEPEEVVRAFEVHYGTEW
ncbi:UNVERIFIED_CONTAM: hypothetical protein RF653_14950 [Kocuria sp. CPCC 205316]|uniref:hypothetical protein n=1 Tax=Kocuria TaxID=57493 RepID=UPI0036DB60B5